MPSCVSSRMYRRLLLYSALLNICYGFAQFDFDNKKAKNIAKLNLRAQVIIAAQKIIIKVHREFSSDETLIYQITQDLDKMKKEISGITLSTRSAELSRTIELQIKWMIKQKDVIKAFLEDTDQFCGAENFDDREFITLQTDTKNPWDVYDKNWQIYEKLYTEIDSGMRECSEVSHSDNEYDKDGFDNHGYNMDGLDKDGYSRDGFDEDGYNRDGFDEDGYSRDGFDEDGYNRDGFDEDGYNRDGFDEDGYNRDGFDKDGYNRDEFDEDGYNRDGFDEDGYNRDGFDKDGYNRDGFDEDGYNRDGFDEDGYNRDGFDEDGYNRDGFDEDGYNRDGFDEDGFDTKGHDKDGFDGNGYNEDGLDEDGYNKDGYNKDGFDREGYSSNGNSEDGFDKGELNKLVGVAIGISIFALIAAVSVCLVIICIKHRSHTANEALPENPKFSKENQSITNDSELENRNEYGKGVPINIDDDGTVRCPSDKKVANLYDNEAENLYGEIIGANNLSNHQKNPSDIVAGENLTDVNGKKVRVKAIFSNGLEPSAPKENDCEKDDHEYSTSGDAEQWFSVNANRGVNYPDVKSRENLNVELKYSESSDDHYDDLSGLRCTIKSQNRGQGNIAVMQNCEIIICDIANGGNCNILDASKQTYPEMQYNCIQELNQIPDQESPQCLKSKTDVNTKYGKIEQKRSVHAIKTDKECENESDSLLNKNKMTRKSDDPDSRNFKQKDRTSQHDKDLQSNHNPTDTCSVDTSLKRYSTHLELRTLSIHAAQPLNVILQESYGDDCESEDPYELPDEVNMMGGTTPQFKQPRRDEVMIHEVAYGLSFRKITGDDDSTISSINPVLSCDVPAEDDCYSMLNKTPAMTDSEDFEDLTQVPIELAVIKENIRMNEKLGIRVDDSRRSED